MNAQMNSTFRGAAAQFLSKQHPITHQQVGPQTRFYAFWHGVRLRRTWYIQQRLPS